MNILIVTDKGRWFDRLLSEFIKKIKSTINITNLKIEFVNDHRTVESRYDVCFLLGYSRIVKNDFINSHSYCLVVHASDLPHGKGMSPLTWQVLEGSLSITFSLFQAIEELDKGDIFIKKELKLKGDELVADLRDKQFSMTLDLVCEFINNFDEIIPIKQQGDGFRYASRGPQDSELDIDKTINEQFNLLRVCDNDNYPAFFYHNGTKYILKIFKESNEEN